MERSSVRLQRTLGGHAIYSQDREDWLIEVAALRNTSPKRWKALRRRRFVSSLRPRFTKCVRFRLRCSATWLGWQRAASQ